MTQADRDVAAAVRRDGVMVSSDALGALAEITHSEVRRLLSDYLENSLPEPESARIRHHLLHCSACRAFRDTLSKSTDLARRLPAGRAPDSAKRRIADQLKSTSRQP